FQSRSLGHSDTSPHLREGIRSGRAQPQAAGAGLRPSGGMIDVRTRELRRRGLAGEPWVPPRLRARHLSAPTRFPVALRRPLGHLSAPEGRVTDNAATLARRGGVAERSNAAVSKTVIRR